MPIRTSRAASAKGRWSRRLLPPKQPVSPCRSPARLAVQTAADRLVVPVEPDIGRCYEQYLLGPPPLGGKALRAWTHLLLI